MCVDAVATSGPEPRATLAVTEGRLNLSGTLGDFKLSSTAVKCVKRAGFYPWLWGGICICHSVPGYPERLQFCPMGVGSRQVLAQLRTLGFKTG